MSRSASRLDRRALALGGLALLLCTGIVAASISGVAGAGIALDRDLYRVAVPSDSPYREPVAESTALDPVPPQSEADLMVIDENRTDRHAEVVPADSAKGQAALGAFRSAVRQHNDRQMRAEPNQTAAFPVSVRLDYVTRDTVRTETEASTEESSETTSNAEGGTDTQADGQLAVPDFGGGSASSVIGGRTGGSPAEISPPFPFVSLLLAFVFLLPMNFVIQAYGSSILNERIDRRGQLLLVAPVSPAEIVAGKTLPYLLAAVGVTAVITFGIATTVGGAGLASVAAVLPIALLFLAATFLGAMLARSFKELTFVTVAISVFLTSYAFVPAIFATVTPIALISPLTIVVRDLQGTGTLLVEYLFSTGPFYLASVVLFLLGTGIYREEDMFSQRSVPLKLLDALSVRLRTPRSVGVLSGLFIPFVFIAELLAVATLFALPVRVSIPLLLLTIAVVEETAKSLHVFAGFHSGRFQPRTRTAVWLGTLSGLGFFLGEKLFVIAQLVGLPSLPIGEAAFAPAGLVGDGASGLLLLVAPLGLHMITAVITALGASRGRDWYGGTLVVASLLHTLYNLAVVVTVG